MPCSCSNRSGCKTSSCECQAKDLECSSRCGCELRVCTNKNDEAPTVSFSCAEMPKKSGPGCECSNKSGCKTSRCQCLSRDRFCNENCGCELNECTNVDDEKPKFDHKPDKQLKVLSIGSKKQSNVAKPDQEIYNLASDLIHRMRRNPTEHEKEATWKLRGDVDAYTGTIKGDLIKSKHQLDHVVEIQMLAHSAAKVIYKPSLVDSVLTPLDKSVNVVENYNFTTETVNKSKGAIVRSYLYDGLYRGYPFLSVALGQKCEKYLGSIATTILETRDSIDRNIRDQYAPNNNVNDKHVYDNIADELSSMIDSMRLDDVSAPYKNTRRRNPT